jgi:2-polyprenyl-6-methoxyphenol hydroxylase-like FAD-dependent oxidoreductase
MDTLRPPCPGHARCSSRSALAQVSVFGIHPGAKIDRVKDRDFVIVGGGIAGGTLATVMARAGATVLLLERQRAYRDHVRGEILWPWGVRLARVLGIEQVLLEGGGRTVRWLHTYDEGASSPAKDHVGAILDGIEGSLNVSHPTACEALVTAAASAGAEIRRGVREVHLTPGARPVARWVDGDGTQRETRCNLIIGADGRRSSVRSQAGIALEVDRPAHLIAGMAAEGIAGIDTINVIARESDLLFFSFPQQGGRARLYLCFPAHEQGRFAGPCGPQRFLRECALGCLEGVAEWGAARIAGPCATFPGEDSRALHPLADGVVLIGDAAGYENPLEGQGLSMALQDAHDVSAALLSTSSPTNDLEKYAVNRFGRQRLANLGVALQVWANDAFAVQDPAQRAARFAHIRNDEVLAALELSFATGFEALPQDLTHADLLARIEGQT